MLGGWRTHRDRNRELADEIASHIRLAVEDRMARGATREQALAAARREFGSDALVMEVTRGMWPGARLARFADSVLRDARHAVPSLLRSPGFLVPALLSLGIGIGATTTLFAALDTFLLRPPPALAGLLRLLPEEPGGTQRAATVADLRAWQAAGTELELAGYTVDAARLELADGVRPAAVARVSDGYFRVTRAGFVRGSAPASAGATDQTEAGVVLAYGAWQRRFGGMPVLGRIVRLDGQPYVVAGVLAPESVFPSRDVEFWVRLPAAAPERSTLAIIGRLTGEGDGDVHTAAARLSAAGRALGTSAADERVRIVAWHEQLITDRLRLAGVIGMTTALLVLLIACANVATLLLARGAARRRELALRRILGAGRARIFQLCLVESALVALAGTALGWFVATWSAEGLMMLWSTIPDARPFASEIVIGGRALAFALAAAGTAVVVFGVLPAFDMSRAEPRSVLAEGGSAATADVRTRRTQRAFVAGQIALSLVLLTSAGLLAKSFIGLQHADLGFEWRHAVEFRVTVPAAMSPAERRAAFAQIEERLAALPGVVAAGAAESLPLAGAGARRAYRAGSTGGESVSRTLPFRIVTPGYHDALGIPVRRGRTFTAADQAGERPVVVINESLARRHWRDTEPLGATLEIDGTWHDIIGVVGDTREWGPHAPGPAMAYGSMLQHVPTNAVFVLRTARQIDELETQVRAAVGSVHSGIAVHEPIPLSVMLAGNTARSLLLARVMTIFAAIAVALAILGVYGAMSYSVAQRVREIGLRRALGGTRRSVIALVFEQGLKITSIGAGVGILLALAATRGLRGFLAGVSPTDPVVIIAAAGALLLTAVVACVVPAYRAARIEPMQALKTE